MKKAYLRGYYGYKNFGDELLFFGIVDRIFSKYPEIEKLVVEVGNSVWMHYWVQKNYPGLITKQQFQKLSFVEIKQHRFKYTTHLLNILGLGKYRSYFKIFGGGEVLSDERNFPHDGRNIPLLFGSTIRKGRFFLIGGIGTPKKRITRFLYKLLLPNAQAIITRDSVSQKIAQIYNKKSELYQDFSQGIIQKYICKKTLFSDDYVLINCNKKSRNLETKQLIVDFCQKHAQYKKIFFPCDMNDDIFCFDDLQQDIPDLEMYDWTKHSLSDSLCVFQGTTAAIGARLHFLLPLKFYNKQFIPIMYAEKIYKMIN